MDNYVQFVQKNTELFTTEKPDDLFRDLALFFKHKNFKFVVSGDKYKIKVNQILASEQELEYSVRILRVDEDRSCVEFCRTAGDQLEFFKLFEELRDELDYDEVSL